MGAPVWVLSVDLQTRTASFQTGLGDAARSARTAFSEIRQGGNEMGRAVGTNMFEARHGVMLLGEEFGIRLPRALTAFITSIGPIGVAMEAAFPFLAIAVGATLLIQALAKMHAAGHEVTEDQIKFGTALQNAFNGLDDKLLQSGIRLDELRNDHMGALAKQLELIDHQSMAELTHSFSEVAKAADDAFKGLESHWYSFSSGSDGAKRSLADFKADYDSLLSKGDTTAASKLLTEKLEREARLLQLQKEAQANSGSLFSAPKDGADLSVGMRAQIALKEAGSHFDDKAIAAQQQLVSALTQQVSMQKEISDTKKNDGDSDKLSAAKAASSLSSGAARAAADSQTRMGTAAVTADKAVAEAQLTIKRGSIEQRLALDLDFANREYAVQMAGNAAQIAALDKLGNDYPNQLKALHDKALELTQANANAVAELTAKSMVAAAARDLQTLEQGEREKIEATRKGSAARLAAINDALKAEEALNLQDTSFYRELLNQRAEVEEQSLEESAKLAEEAGREAAENSQKMGELQLAAWKTNQALQDSSRRLSDQQRVAEETQAANMEYAVKMQAAAKELAALDKSGRDYQNKLKELQDKEKQLTTQHENELTEIREKAEIDRNRRILAASQQFNDQLARGLTASIMGHQSWAKTVDSLGSQVVTGMIQNAVKSMLADDMTKERDAAAAARKAYNIGISMGGPAGMILGPTFAAVTFAAQMAFASGGVVPGVTRGDSVPAMLTPGEGIIPGSMMGRLDAMSRTGNMGGGNHYHLHAPITMHASALDADGVDTVFEKHADKIQAHFENTLRKMNK